jgi:hypothetical protein
LGTHRLSNNKFTNERQFAQLRSLGQLQLRNTLWYHHITYLYSNSNTGPRLSQRYLHTHQHSPSTSEIRSTHQKNKNWDKIRFAQLVYPPTIESLHGESNDGIHEWYVPRVQKSVVDHVGVSKSEDKPVERVCGDHDGLNNLHDRKSVH